MTLQQLQKEAEERFDKGCNTDNISDPPTDKEWIKSFLSSEIKIACEKTLDLIASGEGWEESEEYYAKKLGLLDEVKDYTSPSNSRFESERFKCVK
jgi:hypothetical protein